MIIIEVIKGRFEAVRTRMMILGQKQCNYWSEVGMVARREPIDAPN